MYLPARIDRISKAWPSVSPHSGATLKCSPNMRQHHEAHTGRNRRGGGRLFEQARLVGRTGRAGGRPVMWRSGHTPLKAKLRESGALIAGELSGHIIFQ